jgi:hypothetical protein
VTLAQFPFGRMLGLLASGAFISAFIGSAAFPSPVPLTAGTPATSFATGVSPAANADVPNGELKNRERNN